MEKGLKLRDWRGNMLDYKDHYSAQDRCNHVRRPLLSESGFVSLYSKNPGPGKKTIVLRQ
jgi:hypothetical protein